MKGNHARGKDELCAHSMSSALNNSSAVVLKCPKTSFGNISHKKPHVQFFFLKETEKKQLEVFKMIEILKYLFY